MAFDYSDVTRMAGRLAKAGAAATAGARVGVARAGEQMHAEARAKVPVATGTLRASLRLQVTGLSAVVEATAPYAPFVQYGTARAEPQPFMPDGTAAERDLIATMTAAALAPLR